MSEYYYGMRIIRFTMDGKKMVLNSPRSLTKDELEGMLFHVRRMLGYVVYPRWFTLRLFFSEVIGMFKKNNLYKHTIKQSCKKVLNEFDRLESAHRKGFDNDFIEVMAANLSGKSLDKINEIRGSIGGVLMNHGIKNYILYSYPYAFINLCYDNILTYNFSMKHTKDNYEIDFTDVFVELRGDNLYLLSVKLMSDFIKVVGEDIRGISFKDSNCLEKFETLNNIMSNENNLHDAFQEAFDEMPQDKKSHLKEGMAIWEGESDDFAETLAQKYNVKRTTK